MNATNLFSADVARLREASDWVQELSGPLDQALVDRWTAWCAADPKNVDAFEQMQDVWDGFTAMPVESAPPRTDGRYLRRVAWMSLAAGALLAVGIGGWSAKYYAQVQELVTSPGEQRSETLTDGSRLDLAPDTKVLVHFAPFRRVAQLEHGQAFFAVSHSVLRPFVVRADDLTVTDVGTAFDVRTGPGGTIVTVSEGSVQVTPPTVGGARPKAAPQTVFAGVGQRVTFSMTTHRLSTAAVDPVAAESWRGGVLPFVGEPLEEVVGEINRYSGRKVDVAPGFRQTRFTGTVSLGHVEEWLNALPQIFSVEVIGRGSNDIHIRPRVANDVG
jgi:transmembrane sensor